MLPWASSLSDSTLSGWLLESAPFHQTSGRMIPAQTLGALAGVHERLIQLVETQPARDVNRPFHPRLPSLGWQLGRAVYLETHLLRGVVFGDDDLSGRVRHLFGHGVIPTPELQTQLPPQDHLLNWAAEIFDHHLTLLANPRFLPDHPLLQNGWLPAWLAQRHGLFYERMLAVLIAKTLQRLEAPYQVQQGLTPQEPRADTVRIEQGHYRIGAREGVVMDAEQPMQLVELHAYRIQRHPVSNAEYLAFMDNGGYEEDTWWDSAGSAWRKRRERCAPWHWRQDTQGAWYGIGINGPAELQPQDPVSGINAHEARAFARWAATREEALSGAVPQHEYQWEVAARLGLIEGTGRVWEWCANPFEPYDGYRAPEDPELAASGLGVSGQICLRGACLHTQPTLRRASFRQGADAADETQFAGLRLVLPPGKAAWENES